MEAREQELQEGDEELLFGPVVVVQRGLAQVRLGSDLLGR
jgi:hypothetical protein